MQIVAKEALGELSNTEIMCQDASPTAARERVCESDNRVCLSNQEEGRTFMFKVGYFNFLSVVVRWVRVFVNPVAPRQCSDSG